LKNKIFKSKKNSAQIKSLEKKIKHGEIVPTQAAKEIVKKLW
jgi:hypothetical protein